jgi:YbbR domain-containing protein
MDWMSENLKSLKEYGRDYVLENTGLKVLALLITGVLWLSVASRPVSQVALNAVSIEFFNLSSSPSLIVSKYDTLTARVYLEGPRDLLDSLRAGQFSVTADMSNVEPGVRVIPLSVDPSRLPASVKVKEIEPPSIRVTVERVIEKEVPIIPRFEGEPRIGFEVIDWQITPETVKIGGAESQVRDITEVSTESIRLADRNEAFSEQVAIDIGSPTLTISDDGIRKGKVMLTVNIGEVQKERVVDKIPVTVNDAPARTRVIPKFVKVTVYGPRSIVDEITAADISVQVDYLRGSSTFTPRITLAPGLADRVTVKSVEPQKVSVR